MMIYDLRSRYGPWAVVAGASEGLGAAVAEQLAERGMDPAEVARRTLDALGRGPRIVPGIVNRIAALLMGRLLPRRAAIRLIARNTKHLA